MRPPPRCAVALRLTLWATLTLACASTSPSDTPSLRGQILAEGLTGIAVISPSGDESRALPINLGAALFPSASPDGGRIAFVGYSGTHNEVFLTDAQGRQVQQVTHDSAQVVAPHWSPDGQRLLYTTNPGYPTPSALVSIARDGRDRQMLLPHAHDGHWSPDGTRVLFVGHGSRPAGLYTFRPPDTTVTPLTAGCACEAYSPRWSPDGQQIAFTYRTAQQPSTLAMMNADGTGLIIPFPTLAAGGPVWSPDGRQLAFSQATNFRIRILLLTLATGDTITITPVDSSYTAADWVSEQP